MTKEPTEEWLMLEELHKIHDELTEDAEDFILELHENINPYEPFKEQLIGLPEAVDKKMKWFYSLYEKHINQDREAAEDYWND